MNIFRRGKVLNCECGCFLACPLSWQQSLSFSSRIFKEMGFLLIYSLEGKKMKRNEGLRRFDMRKTDLTVFWKLPNFFFSCETFTFSGPLHSELPRESIQKHHFQCLCIDGRVFVGSSPLFGWSSDWPTWPCGRGCIATCCFGNCLYCTIIIAVLSSDDNSTDAMINVSGVMQSFLTT